MNILRASKLLKGTNIGISNDYSDEVRAVRKELIPFLKKAREENNIAYIKDDKLIINGNAYTLEDCQKDLPTNEKPEIKTNENNENTNVNNGNAKKVEVLKKASQPSKKRKAAHKSSPPLRKYNSLESFIKRFGNKSDPEANCSQKSDGS